MLFALLRRVGFLPAAPLPSPNFAREISTPLLFCTTGYMDRAPTGPVLALDFDGVLHTGRSGTFSCLPLLEAWLRAHPQVDVVISSEWRDHHSFSVLRALFSEDIRPRIIGKTPVFEDGTLREDEILALMHHYHVTRWAALDDAAFAFPSTGTDHLVLTTSHIGLTAESLSQLSTKLGLTS